MAKRKYLEFDGGLLNSSPQEVWIGIDQSYLGFGLTVLGRDGSHFTWVYEAQGTGVARLLDIEQWLAERLNQINRKHTIVDVAMEGYAFSSQMANMAGELGGLVKAVVYSSDIRALIVPPTSLKKYAVGTGTKTSKSQVLLAVYKHWGVEFTDDNAADSYVLARLAAGYQGTLAMRQVLDMLAKGGDKYRA